MGQTLPPHHYHERTKCEALACETTVSHCIIYYSTNSAQLSLNISLLLCPFRSSAKRLQSNTQRVYGRFFLESEEIAHAINTRPLPIEPSYINWDRGITSSTRILWDSISKHYLHHKAILVCAWKNYANQSKRASQEIYAIFIYVFQQFMHYNVWR